MTEPADTAVRRALPCSALLLASLGLFALCASAQAPVDEAAVEPAGPDRLESLVGELNALLPRSDEDRERLRKESAELYALAMLQVDKANIALGSQERTAYATQIATESMELAVSLLKALEDGRRPELPQRGLLERAYLARSDESPQPYLLYVPESYGEDRPHGIVVFLHGYVPYLNKANWKESQYSPSIEELAEEFECLILLPFARSNTDFQGTGEDDVMRAIGEVKRLWKIDEDRVFLSGISMGGMGVWGIGAHYPHEFAALVAFASRGDFYMWKQIPRGSLPGFKAKLAEGEFGAEMVSSYRNLPSVIVHGTMDWVMPIRQSHRMNQLLSDAGFDVTYAELEGVTHYSWGDMILCDAVKECVRDVRRITDPMRVTHRTYNLKYGRAYWAEILAMEDWGKAADLDCGLDPAAGIVQVRTSNVSALRLRPPGGEPAELSVTWNGEEVEARRGADGWLFVGAVPAGPRGLTKTRSLSGPIREAFSGPFVMVYDGPRDGDSFRMARKAAVDWLRFTQGVPKLMPASDVTEDVIERCHLVLFGTPEDNALIARVMPGLPIGIEGGQYRIGDRAYDAAEHGLSVIYPNPLAPDRYVVVNSGRIWGAGLAPNHKYDMLPDFIVFTDDVVRDGTDSNRFMCAGFFDQRWQLDERSTWYASAPEDGDGADP